jgi:hypothetical protein
MQLNDFLVKYCSIDDTSVGARSIVATILIAFFCLVLKLAFLVALGGKISSMHVGNVHIADIFITCALYPILLEVHFRLWLKPSKYNLSISLLSMAAYYSFYAWNEIGAFGVLLSLSLFAVLVLIVESGIDPSAISIFYKKNILTLTSLSLFFSCMFFIDPFMKYHFGTIILAFVIQLLINLSITFVRIKYGFVLAVIVHAIVATLGLATFK